MSHLEPDHFRDPAERARVGRVIGSLRDEPAAFLDPPDGLWAEIAAAAAVDADESVPPTVLRSAPRWRTPLLAAAALVIVAGVAVVVATRSADTPPERLLASATLAQLEPLGTASAQARLVDENGTRHLIIDASDMPPAPDGSDYELWLIDKGATDPKSLGTVDGSGDVVVPPSIDPERYPLVDISLEPRDGDHRHSGHSLMRGELS